MTTADLNALLAERLADDAARLQQCLLAVAAVDPYLTHLALTASNASRLLAAELKRRAGEEERT